MAKRKRTAKAVAEEITYGMVEALKTRWEKFCKGDPTASLTDVETRFLLDTIKTAQEGEQGEAVVGYLQDMSDKDLDAYHERLKAKLEGENTN